MEINSQRGAGVNGVESNGTLTRHQIYHASNRASRNKYSEAYYAKNKAKQNRRRRAHYRKHRREQIAAGIERTLKRYHSDPQFKLRVNLASRIYRALRGGAKAATTMALIGCTPEELRRHLEKQFTPGMTWENYGAWQVDHIRACARFDLTKPDEQRACFHFTNLQPLWTPDNLRKGARDVRPNIR